MDEWMRAVLSLGGLLPAGALAVGLLVVALLLVLGGWYMLRRHAAATRRGARRPDAANQQPSRATRPGAATRPGPISRPGPTTRPGVAEGQGARHAAPPLVAAQAPGGPPAAGTAPEGTSQSFRLAVPDLVAHFRQWGSVARSTAPIDRTHLEAAVHALYAAAGLKAPRVVVVPSPLAMMLAYSVATAMVWARGRQESPVHAGDALAAEKEARHAGSGFLSNPASEAIENLRSAALRRARGPWGRARRLLPAQMDRLEQQGTLHLEDHAAAAVREHLLELTAGSPDARARWKTESLAAYFAAAEAAVQAADVDRPAWLAASWTLDGLLACADCCTMAGDEFLRAYFEASLMAATQPARWTPLQAQVPMIGAARHLLRQPGAEFQRFQAWEACAREAGDLLVHPEFCIVSERPDLIRLDERGLLHGENGPSVCWRDGWCLHHWHGTRIPSTPDDVITDLGFITAEDLDGEPDDEPNGDLRAAGTVRSTSA